MEKFYYKSPIGILEIVAENMTVVSLSLADAITENWSKSIWSKNIKSQLDEYFAGKRQKFDIKINPKGTEFQKRVWRELIKIPYGHTTNYSDIACKIGNPKASRAVGNACHRNPIMIIIPCHRVLSKNDTLGGFAYGIETKKALLSLEKFLK